MKQLVQTFCLLLISAMLQAQVPMKFNYQGVARDSKGLPLSKQTMSLKLRILPTMDATVSEYEETQTVVTNEFGLYTLQIGQGNVISGTMAGVKWETGNKYIHVSIDPKGGDQFQDAGTTQLLSVPYAIYADKAGVARETAQSQVSGTRATNNYIEKTSSAGVTNSNSMLYDNGSGVALGFATPLYTFESRRPSNTDWCIRTTNAAGTSRSAFRIQNEDSTLGQLDLVKFGKNYGGTFMGLSRNNMGVINSLTGPFVLNCGGDMIFGSSLTVSPYTQTPRLTINGTSGNVGIGLPLGGVAAAKLEVNGQIKINGGTPGAGKVLTSNASGLATWQTPSGGGGISGTANYMPKFLTATTIGNSQVFDNGTNVGIGTAVPAAKLDVAGQVKISGGAPGAGKVLTSDASGLATWQTPAAGGSSQWTTSSANIYNNNTGNVGIGITNPLHNLHVNGTTAANFFPIIKSEYTGASSNFDVIGIEGVSTPANYFGIGISGKGNYKGVDGYSLAGYGLYGESNQGYGAWASSNLNFGMRSYSAKSSAVYAESDSMTTGDFRSSAASGAALYNGVLSGQYVGNVDSDYVGVRGRCVTPLAVGIGVVGDGGSVGVQGFSSSVAVSGKLNANSSGVAVNADGGINGLGVFAFSSNQEAVQAITVNGNALAASSFTGIGISSVSQKNTAGDFQAGDGFISSSLTTNGVINGEYVGSYSQDAIGVRGKATQTSAFGIGVVGNGNWYGVYGNSPNYAGYFNGILYASTVSGGTKTFRIDHPMDPTNKFLIHSSIESNDMMNIYNGNITTDANGDATVQLPHYFETLNIDFKYQLTVIGTFAQAIISEEVQNNQFKIKTNQPNVKVSWQVAGVRNDPTAQAHRIVDEVEKTGREKGKYLDPEAYGRPKSEGMVPEHLTNSDPAPAPSMEKVNSRLKQNAELEKKLKPVMDAQPAPVNNLKRK